MYYWAHDEPQRRLIHECEISKNTISNFCNLLRGICTDYLVQSPHMLGGFDDDGNSVIVEIDESKYFHRKFHRITWREGH